MNLFDTLRHVADRQPTHDACIELRQERRLSYEELLHEVERAGRLLRESGISPGSCVGIHGPSGIDYIVWAYGIWAAGGVVVPVAPELDPAEKQSIAKDIPLAAIVCLGNVDTGIDFVESERPATILDRSCTLRWPRSFRSHPPGFTALDPAFIRFTSGTTAASKGVVLSHATVWERVQAANQGLHVGSGDSILWLLSMSYHFAVTIVAYLSYGARIVQCAESFGASVVDAARRTNATIIYGSPSHFEFMARDASGTMLPALRLALSTASPLMPGAAERFSTRFGIPVRQAYGVIEVGLSCINLGEPAAPWNSVGKPLPPYDLRLRDVGLGENLRAIDVRGPGLLDAYYKPWRVRNEIAPDDWFATGDLGYLDDDGHVYLAGRSNSAINVGGMKVFPNEVEEILERHVAIAQALVYGVPHPLLGEVPHADVVIRAGETRPIDAELIRFCQAALGASKVPRSVRIVPDLPRTASGKVRRNQSAIQGES